MQKTTILMLGLCLVAAASCGNEQQLPPVAQARQADFVNGGFENSDFNGWTVSTNLNPGAGIPMFPPTAISSLGLVTGGVNKSSVQQGATPESQVPSGLTAADSLRYPRFGKYSAVINEGGNNNNSNTITQSLTTTQADVDAVDGRIHVRFALAPVLENPNHLNYQQPYFYIEIANTTTNKILFSSFNFSNQPGVPFKNASANAGVQYTDWQLFDLAPGPTGIAIGDQLRATVIATGCSLGGHYGQLYVDGFGTFIPGLTVVASGPQSANADTDITYTFTSKNGSTTAADNVVVTEVLPAGTTFVSVKGATCTTPSVGMAGTVTCNLGTLAPNGTSTFMITVHIDPTATGTINNGNYTIQGTGINPLIGPLVQTAITNGVVYTDLAITATSANAAADWGTPVSYTIVARNNGPVAVIGALISNMVPAQLTGVTWTCTGQNNGVCGAANGTGPLTTVANLPVGASVTYVVNGTIVAGTGTGLVSYLVNIDPPALVSDPNTSNNSAVFVTNIGPVVALTVDKGTSTGTGTVSSAPVAISCGPTCTTQSAKFLSGSMVTLTAVPAPGSTFTGWGGACANAGTAPQCTVTLAAAAMVSANFSLPTYPITTSVPAGNGTVSCPSPVVQGRDAVCTATPAPGYVLDTVTINGKDGSSTVGNNSFTVANVQGPTDVQAVFKKDLGTGCGGTTECHSGFCTSGVCCDTACDGACQACTVTGQVGVCGSACGNFACSTEQNSCYNTCQTNEQCVSGGLCVDGACLPPAQGQYALSGGGLSGCTYGDPKGASGTAALAGLAMLAFLARRRRSFGRAAA